MASVSRYLANALGKVADREIRRGLSGLSGGTVRSQRSPLSSPFDDSGAAEAYSIEEELRRKAEEEEARKKESEQAEKDSKIKELQENSNKSFFDMMEPEFVKKDRSAKEADAAADLARRSKIKEDVLSSKEPEDDMERARNEFIKDYVQNGYQPQRWKSQGIPAEPISFDEALDAWESSVNGELTTGIPFVGPEIAKGMARDKIASFVTARQQNKTGSTGMQKQAKDLEDAALSVQQDWQQAARDVTGIGGTGGDSDFLKDPGAFFVDTVSGLIPGAVSIAPSMMRGSSDLLHGTVINDEGEAESRLPGELTMGAAGPAVDLASLVFTGGVGSKLAKEVLAKSTSKSALAKSVKEIGKAAVVEGGQEVAQTAMEKIADDEHITLNDIVNSAAGGAIGGSVFSGSSAVVSGAKSRSYNKAVDRMVKRQQASEGAGVDLSAPGDSVDASALGRNIGSQALPTSLIKQPAFSIGQAPEGQYTPPAPAGLTQQGTPATPTGLEQQTAPQMAPQVPQNAFDQVGDVSPSGVPYEATFGRGVIQPTAEEIANQDADAMAYRQVLAEEFADQGRTSRERAAAADTEAAFRRDFPGTPTAEELSARKAASDAAMTSRIESGTSPVSDQLATEAEPATTDAVKLAVRRPTSKNIEAALPDAVSAVFDADEAVQAATGKAEAAEASRTLEAATENVAVMLQPLANRYARADKLVADGTVKREDASSEILSVWTEAIMEDPLAFADDGVQRLLKRGDTNPSNVISRYSASMSKDVSVEAAGGVEHVSAKKSNRERTEQAPRTAEEKAAAGIKEAPVKVRGSMSKNAKKKIDQAMTREEYEASRQAAAAKPAKAESRKENADKDDFSSWSKENADLIVGSVMKRPDLDGIETNIVALREAWDAVHMGEYEGGASFEEMVASRIEDKVDELDARSTRYDDWKKYYNAVATDIKNSSDEVSSEYKAAEDRIEAAKGSKKAAKAVSARERRAKRAEARKAAEELGAKRKRVSAYEGKQVKELTELERIHDSVVDAASEFLLSDAVTEASSDRSSSMTARLLRETDKAWYGNDVLIKDAVTLGEFEAYIADAIDLPEGSAFPDGVSELIGEIYADESFNKNNYLNRPSRVVVRDGKVKSSEPESALLLSMFGSNKRIEVSRDNVTVPVSSNGFKPIVGNMISAVDASVPIYIADSGVLPDGVIGLTDNIDGVYSIIINNDYAKADGLPFAESSEGVVAHEATHVFLRSLDVVDSPRAAVLRKRLDELINKGEFDYYVDLVKSRYSDMQLSRDEMNEEAIAMAVADYAAEINDRIEVSHGLGDSIRLWIEDFVRFIKRAFHIQDYSISEILEMNRDELVASVANSSFDGIKENVPNPFRSMSSEFLALLSPENLVEVIVSSDRSMVDVLRKSVSFGSTTKKPPSRTLVGLKEIAEYSDIVHDGESVEFDSNGSPVPPGNIPITFDAFESAVAESKRWSDWVDAAVENKRLRDEPMTVDVSDRIATVREDMPTLKQVYDNITDYAGPYAPNLTMLRSHYVNISKRIYNSQAAVSSLESVVINVEANKAKAKLKNAENLSPEQIQELKREADKSAAVQRVAVAKIESQRARDRISGIERRIGLRELRNWAIMDKNRIENVKRYMHAREILGAYNVIYDKDQVAFTDLAHTLGFESPSDMLSWAESVASSNVIPAKMKKAADNSVKEIGDIVVNNAYDAGQIDASTRDRILEMNKDGSYWILKLEKNEKTESLDDLLTGDPNALVNPTGNSIIKSKADQFTLAAEHPIEALDAALTLSTFQSDKAKMNKAVVNYALRLGIAHEFDIDVYRLGSKGLDPDKLKNMSEQQRERIKQVADELQDEWSEKDGDIVYKFLEFEQDGKSKAYQVPAELYDSLVDIGIRETEYSGARKGLNHLANSARRFSSVVRWFTTTANVSLQTVLLARDLLTISMLGPTYSVSGALGMPVYMAKALYQTLEPKENAKLSELGIAGDAFTRASTRDPRQEVLKAFNNMDMDVSSAKATSEMAVHSVEHVLNIMETFARATLYNQSLKAASDLGLTGNDAVSYAKTIAAEGIGNFREAGTWVRGISQYAAYSNASMQGARGAVKMFVRQPVLNSLRIATSIAGAYLVQQALVSAFGYDDDEWEDVVNAIPDSQKHRGIPMPKLGEEPRINLETNKLEGVWFMPVPEVLYPIINVISGDGSRTQKERMTDVVTLFIEGLTGISVHGSGGKEISYSLMNQWTPNIAKPPMELLLNVRLYNGMPILDSDKLKDAEAGLIKRNDIEAYGVSDREKAIASMLTDLGLDVNAADIDLIASSLGALPSNFMDEKPIFSFGGVTSPFANKKAMAPINKDEMLGLLYDKWASTEFGYSSTEKDSAKTDFYSAASKAETMFNMFRYGDSTPEERRAFADGTDDEDGVTAKSAFLMAVSLDAEARGLSKKEAADKAASLWPKTEAELFDEDKFSKEDVVEYYTYIGAAGEAMNSPTLKAQAVLATDDRFWKPGVTGEDRAKMMSSLREEYRAVNKVKSAIDKSMSDDPTQDISTVTRELAGDITDSKMKILFSRYEEKFDPDLWYSSDDIKNELKADTDSVSDERYNDHSLRYYEALYEADGDLFVKSRDDLSDKYSSGYLYTVAKINKENSVPKYIQQMYGDLGTNSGNEWNISLTAWRELEETDPELFDLLYQYDTIRTEAGVSKNKDSSARKYYLKEKSGSSGRRGGGGGGGGAASFHVPSVADLLMKTYTPKGNKVSTGTSVKKKSVAPVTPTTVGKTAAAGKGIKTEPTNFKGAKTVKYERAKTRQPAMGEPYSTFLKGGSTQDSFKAARRYI